MKSLIQLRDRRVGDGERDGGSVAVPRALGHPLAVGTTNAPAWRLRPGSPADLEWAFELHRTTLREYVEPIWGWDDVLQRCLFTDTFDRETCQIIQVDGQDVGVLMLDERPDELYVSRLELLPAWQGRGLGTSIMLWLLHVAHAGGRPVRLHVLKTNARAAALYERIGLRVVASEPVKVMMRSTP